MPTGKRASMREGPLAALFRKTSVDLPEKESQRGSRAKPRRASGADSKPAPQSKSRASGADSKPAPQSKSPASGADSKPAPQGKSRASGAEGKPATRSGSQPPGPRERSPRVPTPKERLRHAFSADIPHNLLDPSREVDVYARPERPGAALAASLAAERFTGKPVIRVVGVGGGGVNAVNRMVEAEIEGVEFLAINTDLQSLQTCAAHDTLHIGGGVTRGLGSGSDPELGRLAAREEYDRMKAMLRGSDMVFIAAGAGGGTGTGAAPVLAEIARELGALTVGIVTRPFQFEGSRRREQAETGIRALRAEVDTLIVVPNNRLLSVLDRNTSIVEAFRVADDVLRQGVQGVSDLVTLPGLINLDFADVRTIMSGAGSALLGIGMGTGENRALDAAEKAVSSPLLETSVEGARSILLSITGGLDLSLWEVNEAARAVSDAAHSDANIIFGAMLDEKLSDQVWVTVVATGFGERAARPVGRFAEERVERSTLREPPGEPQISRVREPAFTGRFGDATSITEPLDVPEFIPRR